jgi:hypothetical protein
MRRRRQMLGLRCQRESRAAAMCAGSTLTNALTLQRRRTCVAWQHRRLRAVPLQRRQFSADDARRRRTAPWQRVHRQPGNAAAHGSVCTTANHSARAVSVPTGSLLRIGLYGFWLGVQRGQDRRRQRESLSVTIATDPDNECADAGLRRRAGPAARANGAGACTQYASGIACPRAPRAWATTPRQGFSVQRHRHLCTPNPAL